jgi:hypothetical protein
MSDLLCLAHEGPPTHPVAPDRHDCEAVRPRRRASRYRGESPAQAATNRPAPCSPPSAEPDAARPAALRIRVALPQSRTHPKGRHRRTQLDAPGVASGVGASHVPPTILIEPVPQEPRTEGAERGTHPGHRRVQVARSSVRLSTDWAQSSRTRSGSTSTGTSCTAYCRNTIATLRAEPGPRGCHLSDTRQTGCGAWTSFDANSSCSGVTGCSWSWTSSPVASSELACTVVRSMAPTSAACSTPPFIVGAHRDISVPIMIRRSRRTGGRRTFRFWRSMKSRLCLMCPFHTPSWSAGSGRAARISRPCAVLECP